MTCDQATVLERRANDANPIRGSPLAHSYSVARPSLELLRDSLARR